MEEEKGKSRKRSRLVLVPCPFQGHINPMLQLGTILHSRGFSITIAHSEFNSPDPSKHPDFEFMCFSDGLTHSTTGDLVAFLMLVNDNCKAPFQECLDQLTGKCKDDNADEKISGIIYDEFMYFAEAVANQRKLPSIVLCTTSATTFIFRDVIPWLQGEGKTAIQGLGSQDIVPGFGPLRVKDLRFSKFTTLRISAQIIGYVLDTSKTSSAVIFNTTDFLERPSLQKVQQRCQIPLFSIGPMHKFTPNNFSGSLIKEDHSCIAWLDKQTNSSVLYISLGSLTPMTQNEFVEFAWGLANSKQPFLWVVRPGSVLGSDWIESLPVDFKESVGERGCIVKWAPQKKVLAHAAVTGFWSHCGWNSTMESISEGVPMICRPNSGDQKVNARYVTYLWRVGLEFENDVLERGEVERVVGRLMADVEGMEIRKTAKDLKEKVEVCIGKGGSSSNSLNDLVELIRSFC